MRRFNDANDFLFYFHKDQNVENNKNSKKRE